MALLSSKNAVPVRRAGSRPHKPSTCVDLHKAFREAIGQRARRHTQAAIVHQDCVDGTFADAPQFEGKDKGKDASPGPLFYHSPVMQRTQPR